MDIVSGMNHIRWSALGQSALSLSLPLFLSTSRKELFLPLNQQPVDNEWWRNTVNPAHTRKKEVHSAPRPPPAHTHTGWGKVTYWKASGQSSLDIHCHSIWAGMGNPRVLHLRVWLLPYGCTSLPSPTPFSIIWGGTVGREDSGSYHNGLTEDEIKGKMRGYLPLTSSWNERLCSSFLLLRIIV